MGLNVAVHARMHMSIVMATHSMSHSVIHVVMRVVVRHSFEDEVQLNKIGCLENELISRFKLSFL